MTKPIQLYYSYFQDRSDRVRWTLEEIKQFKTLEYVDCHLDREKNEHKKEAYLKLNPQGRIPTIVDGETILFESQAIVSYLSDKYALGKLAPNFDHPDRALYYQWMAWSVGSLECVIARMFTHKNTPEESAATDAFVQKECLVLQAPLLKTLAHQEYLLPSGFSSADIMVGSILPGAQEFIVDPHPTISAYLERLKGRDGCIKAKVF